MKCVICRHGELYAGETTVTLQRGGTTIIFKDVPADICNNCGEYFVSEKITERLLNRSESAVKNGTEVEILKFAA
ncbi:MAG: type II toxin-antitoxin system MqsA family antitoxin [bacterium]